jgi:methylmalonyl-CoA mutase C-terminal domain/subunit
MTLLKEHDALDILVVLGGTIPTHDIPALKEAGVAAIFGPGTPLETTVDFIRQNVKRSALSSSS